MNKKPLNSITNYPVRPLQLDKTLNQKVNMRPQSSMGLSSKLQNKTEILNHNSTRRTSPIIERSKRVGVDYSMQRSPLSKNGDRNSRCSTSVENYRDESEMGMKKRFQTRNQLVQQDGEDHSASPQKNWKDIEDEIRIMKKALRENIAEIASQKEKSVPPPCQCSRVEITGLQEENAMLKSQIEQLQRETREELQEIVDKERSQMKEIVSQYKTFIDKLLLDKKQLNEIIHAQKASIQTQSEQIRDQKLTNDKISEEINLLKYEYAIQLEKVTQLTQLQQLQQQASQQSHEQQQKQQQKDIQQLSQNIEGKEENMTQMRIKEAYGQLVDSIEEENSMDCISLQQTRRFSEVTFASTEDIQNKEQYDEQSRGHEQENSIRQVESIDGLIQEEEEEDIDCKQFNSERKSSEGQLFRQPNMKPSDSWKREDFSLKADDSQDSLLSHLSKVINSISLEKIKIKDTLNLAGISGQQQTSHKKSQDSALNVSVSTSSVCVSSAPANLIPTSASCSQSDQIEGMNGSRMIGTNEIEEPVKQRQVQINSEFDLQRQYEQVMQKVRDNQKARNALFASTQQMQQSTNLNQTQPVVEQTQQLAPPTLSQSLTSLQTMNLQQQVTASQKLGQPQISSSSSGLISQSLVESLIINASQTCSSDSGKRLIQN